MMGNVSLVLGQAGTGKTKWLMDQAINLAPHLLSKDYQKVLAISRMHGARRRLDARFRETKPRIQNIVATIDSVAASLVNRWRQCCGYQRQICPVFTDANFIETVCGIEAHFDYIIAKAVDLLNRSTVARIIGDSYPLILVDEFQDCHGSRLEFIKSLCKCTTVVLAADEFQLLDTEVQGCPAHTWALDEEKKGSVIIEKRTETYRTSNMAILNAARCLRENIKSTIKTVPVILCPRNQAAAWKIIDHLVLGWYSPRWTGTCVLVSPSYNSLVQRILDSCSDQLQRKSRAPLHWHIECSERVARDRTAINLGITKDGIQMDHIWKHPSQSLDELGIHIINRVQRFARLRGLNAISQRLVAWHANMVLHEQHAYGALSPKRIVTTIHGAKNREFDNVFVLWNPRSIQNWNSEEQRRLLYNAVTRAKQNCTVLVIGSETIVNSDPVLSLLGPPEPAFPPKPKKSATSSKEGKTR